jgi:hypothetical protein
MTTERYGNVRAVTIYNLQNRLRKLIASEGTPALQEAWDKMEQYIHSPHMWPKEEIEK